MPTRNTPGFIQVRQLIAGGKLRSKLYGFGDLTYKARPVPNTHRYKWSAIFRFWCGTQRFTYKEIFEICDTLIPVVEAAHKDGTHIRPPTNIGIKTGEGRWDEAYDVWLRNLVTETIVAKAQELGRTTNRGYHGDGRASEKEFKEMLALNWAKQALVDGCCPVCGEKLPEIEPSCHGFAGIVFKDGSPWIGMTQILPEVKEPVVGSVEASGVKSVDTG